MWAGRDLNPRRPKPADLQSAAIDHSATYPTKSNTLSFSLSMSHSNLFLRTCPYSGHFLFSLMSHLSDSDRRPTVYKTVALPTELRWRKLLFLENIFYHIRNLLFLQNVSISFLIQKLIMCKYPFQSSYSNFRSPVLRI